MRTAAGTISAVTSTEVTIKLPPVTIFDVEEEIVATRIPAPVVGQDGIVLLTDAGAIYLG